MASLPARQPTARRRALRLAAVVLAGLCSLPLAGGCSPELDTHGDVVEANQLAQLRPGVHKKDDVTQILGSPSSTAVFNNDVWYYISDVVERYSVFDTVIKQRQVLTLRFDNDDVLQSIDEHGLERGRDVEIVDRETPSFGETPSFIQQVIGNLGRFNKDDTQGPRR